MSVLTSKFDVVIQCKSQKKIISSCKTGLKLLYDTIISLPKQILTVSFSASKKVDSWGFHNLYATD